MLKALKAIGYKKKRKKWIKKWLYEMAWTKKKGPDYFKEVLNHYH